MENIKQLKSDLELYQKGINMCKGGLKVFENFWKDENKVKAVLFSWEGVEKLLQIIRDNNDALKQLKKFETLENITRSKLYFLIRDNQDV